MLGRERAGQRGQAPVGRRRDDAQQRSHRVATTAAPAQVTSQRNVDRDGVALGVARSSSCSAMKRRMSSGDSRCNLNARPANLASSSRCTMRRRFTRVVAHPDVAVQLSVHRSSVLCRTGAQLCARCGLVGLALLSRIMRGLCLSNSRPGGRQVQVTASGVLRPPARDTAIALQPKPSLFELQGLDARVQSGMTPHASRRVPKLLASTNFSLVSFAAVISAL